MDYLRFDIKLFFWLALSFAITTVVGTLTHEVGHYSVARILGYQAQINYMSCKYWDNDDQAFFKEIGQKYPNELINDQHFPEKARFLGIAEKYKKDGFLITLAGPLQTITTGTLGLILIIYFRRKVIRSDRITISGWVLILLSLFWLRQLANLFMLGINYIQKGKISERGDEVRIAGYLNINNLTVQVVTGLIGVLVLLYIIKLIPKSQLLTFLMSGLVGGVAGYYLWLIKFGSVILP